MKKVDVFAGGVVVALALIGAGEVVHRAVQGAAWALSAWGGWDATEATRAAPWVLFALGFGLLLSVSGMLSTGEHYKRSAEKQRSSLTVTEGRKQDVRRGA